jgi:hypothetical protein
MISNAATEAENVVGLVFVAAYAPEEDEALGEAAADSTDSVLNSALVPDVVMISQPEVVTDVILEACAAVGAARVGQEA